MDKDHCPTETALEIIHGKWKGIILFYLIDQKKRFGELQSLMPDISQRILTKQLRELEANGIITRQVFDEVPPESRIFPHTTRQRTYTSPFKFKIMGGEISWSKKNS